MIIRRGITRTVILTRRYAVKVPSLRPYGHGFRGLLWSLARGVLANQSEAEWWREADPGTRSLLCPVLRSWLGGIVNVYPRCEDFVPTEAQALAIRTGRWQPVQMRYPDPGDHKPDNYGWLRVSPRERRLVSVDYDMSYNGCVHDRSGVRANASKES